MVQSKNEIVLIADHCLLEEHLLIHFFPFLLKIFALYLFDFFFLITLYKFTLDALL